MYKICIFGFVAGSPIDGRYILTAILSTSGGHNHTHGNIYLAYGLNEYSLNKLDMTVLSITTIKQQQVDYYCEAGECRKDVDIGGYESVLVMNYEERDDYLFWQVTRLLLSFDWYDSSLFILKNRRICAMAGLVSKYPRP